MRHLYLCLGANSGDRVETLIQAAARVSLSLGATGFSCSSVYADRHRQSRTGATTNLAIRLDGVPALMHEDMLVAQLREIEDDFGRVRDPERELPVTLDIDWLGSRVTNEPAWDERYDRGAHYVWQGLYELRDEHLQVELDRLCTERDFTPAENARGFYGLVSRHYTAKLIQAAIVALAPFVAEPESA